MSDVQESNTEVLKIYEQVREQYFKDMNEASKYDKEHNEGNPVLFDVIQKYSKVFEELADAILGQKFEDSFIVNAVCDMPCESNRAYLDDEILQYVIDNAQYLKRTGVIKTFNNSEVYCLNCGKKLKGIGIMDWADAGTNAICLGCTSSEVYVGDGISFTDFC